MTTLQHGIKADLVASNEKLAKIKMIANARLDLITSEKNECRDVKMDRYWLNSSRSA